MQARAAAVKSAFGPALQPNRTGLPDKLKASVEAASGLSMDDVRVVRNSDKPAQLQALAYAQGTEIHLARGQEKHLPHEAWHVVQQKQGRVKPTLQMKGVAISDDHGLEAEADLALAQFGRVGAPAGERRRASAASPGVAQRKVVTNGGVFDTTEYEVDNDARPTLGANITMTFLPKEAGPKAEAEDEKAGAAAASVAKAKPSAEMIGMIQTNKRTVMIHPHDAGKPEGKSALTEIESARAFHRTHIDRADLDEKTRTLRQNNPVYQSTENTPDTKDTPGFVAKSIADIPKTPEHHGMLWTSDKPKEPAVLIDKPRCSVEDKTSIVVDEFETAAVVLKGEAANTYLGSVKWGWEAQGFSLRLRPFTLAKAGDPSRRFLAAARKWNEQKLPADGKGEKMPTIKVPIPRGG